MTERIITADARKVSSAQFVEALLGPRKQNETFERCIRVIQNGGDLYGWPPAMVEHCRKLIAERELPMIQTNPGTVRQTMERIEQRSLGNGWHRWCA